MHICMVDCFQFNIQIRIFQRFEILAKITFHIFPKISSNNILSLNTRSKENRPTKVRSCHVHLLKL